MNRSDFSAVNSVNTHNMQITRCAECVAANTTGLLNGKVNLKDMQTERVYVALYVTFCALVCQDIYCAETISQINY